jgi:two-component system LytT family response regulator
MLGEFKQLELVGEADHPDSALLLITEKRPDVLFLDIHMPGQSGFDLLDRLDYIPQVIFTTAYSEYAYRSFDYNPVDYLLKPISPERLASAIDKLSLNQDLKIQEPFDMSSKIFIKDGDDCHLVSLREVHYFESCKNHSRVFFESYKPFIKKALSSIEGRLPKSHFFRANRQYVVNLNKIRSINESISDGYDLTMNDGQIIDVSRRNAVELKRLLSF